MKDLVEFIAKSLVEDVQAVKLDIIEEDNATIINLTVAKKDIGRIIGKQGKIISSIRTILNSNNERKQYKLVVIDNE